jgi:hypothetical protein
MTDAEFQTAFEASFSSVQDSIDAANARIVEITRAALENPSRSSAYWNGIRSQIEDEYARILSAFDVWASSEIPAAYKVYAKDAVKVTKSLLKGARGALATAEHVESAQPITAALYRDAVANFAAALSSGKEDLFRLTRMTQQSLIQEWMLDKTLAESIEAGNVSEVISRLAQSSPQYKKLLEAARSGATIEAGGRHFEPRYYAELVARTKFHEAQSVATLSTAAAYGTDLVKVSSHNTETAICKPHEDKVYSISGKDKRFPALGETPPFHPKCLHLLYPHFEEALAVDGAA